VTIAAAPSPVAPSPAVPVRPAPPVPRLRLLRHEPEPEPGCDPRDPVRGPTRRPSPAVPDDLHPTAGLRRRAHQVLLLVLEVVDGRRPLAHVVPHLDPRVVRYVRATCGPRAARPPVRMTSLHVHRPQPGAVEVAAVVRAGPRARVVAARFEGHPDAPDRWRCVTFRLL
jgi:uncharacterized protein DUF6459